MTTFGEALAAARSALTDIGAESAGLDARLLLAAASKLDLAALIARGPEDLSAIAQAAFDEHIRRRLAGEPVSRILGEKEFWGLPIAVGAAALVPRPETETLVEVALAAARRRFASQITICDLGTGTGAILIALLTELPEARGVATDVSQGALAIAQRNAERLGVASRIEFRNDDFASGPSGRFNMIVANPPYIRSGAIDELQREVRDHDPRVALDGGVDGLAAFRSILGRIDSMLVAGGFLGFEVGADQGQTVAALCRATGLSEVCVHPDLARQGRVVSAVRTMPATALQTEKKRLEKLDGRASFPQQTREKPQGWASFSGRRRQRSLKAGSPASPSLETSRPSDCEGRRLVKRGVQQNRDLLRKAGTGRAWK
jgi:release factor glutamine methyltransferase